MRRTKIKKIKLILTDCDGVLTDSGMYYFDNGLEAKKFNTRDGKAFEILRNQGYKIGVITGEKTNIVKNRAKKLKMDIVVLGVTNKIEFLNKICNELKITNENVMYIGDDINDEELLKNVGFSACPKDAHKRIKKVVDYISTKNGGYGVIRDIVDKFFDGGIYNGK